jgi:hypothetical protein
MTKLETIPPESGQVVPDPATAIALANGGQKALLVRQNAACFGELPRPKTDGGGHTRTQPVALAACPPRPPHGLAAYRGQRRTKWRREDRGPTPAAGKRHSAGDGATGCRETIVAALARIQVSAPLARPRFGRRFLETVSEIPGSRVTAPLVRLHRGSRQLSGR